MTKKKTARKKKAKTRGAKKKPMKLPTILRKKQALVRRIPAPKVPLRRRLAQWLDPPPPALPPPAPPPTRVLCDECGGEVTIYRRYGNGKMLCARCSA